MIKITEKLEKTTLTSRGQIVIPQDIREHLGLKMGAKFIVVGRDDTIMLKKIEMPKFERFDNIIKKGRHFASKKGIKPEDVTTAIDEYRKEKNR